MSFVGNADSFVSCLDTRLLTLAHNIQWTLRDAVQGAHAFGMTGGGKSTALAILAGAFLRAGMGGHRPMKIQSFTHALNLTQHIGRIHGIGTNFNNDFWGPTDDARVLARRIDRLREIDFMRDSEQGRALLAHADALRAEIAKGGE
jgi:hypothetical protein